MGNRRKKNTTPNPTKRSGAKQLRGKAGKISQVVPKQPTKSKKAATKRKISAAKQQLSNKKVKNTTLKNTTRTDHSNNPIFRKAAETWLIPKLRLSNEKSEHARLCGVEECHISTFLRYIDDDIAKRRILGKFSGRPSVVDDETTEFLLQYVISYANDKELSNAQIVKKLLEKKPKLSPFVAGDYVRRTFRRKLNEYSKPTQPEEGFRLIPLPKGTSNCLQRLVRKHVKGVKEQDVFSCDPGTHKSLSRPQRNKFTRLKGTEDSFTDRKRKLQNICQDDFNKEEVVAKILSILRDNLDVAGYDIEEPVLLTTEESTDTIFRQQLHRDFRNGSKSMFVIIPLREDQTLYYEKNKGISSITLSKDVAFVGHASLIHAGSAKTGKRLHFKLVPKGQVEDTKTYFVKDSLYPGISGVLNFD